jgi:hypothetical protein
MRMTCLRIQVGGSLFGYHQCIKRDKAGPFFVIKWVPFVVLKTDCMSIRNQLKLPVSPVMKHKSIMLIASIVLSLIVLTGGFLVFARHTQAKPLSKTNADNCYLAQYAKEEIGKDTCVQFYVNNSVKSKNGNIFLNENQDYKKGFSVTIYANTVNNFPISPIYYQYRTIEAVGVIKLYQGHPEIIVSDPAYIHVLR